MFQNCVKARQWKREMSYTCPRTIYSLMDLWKYHDVQLFYQQYNTNLVAI